tara:strand:+ start:193 stop:702 length:510 start_codon:yes stop_codon:yes gene_type:complete
LADYLITGCSGGGKSTLIAELADRGFRIVAEPGRRLIADGITPWDDLCGFLLAAVDTARADLEIHRSTREPVFYDRGLIDALAGLERLGAGSVMDMLGSGRPYEGLVFIAPPWPEIHATDTDRRHAFDEAVEEYRHLAELLPALGYRPVELPRTSVAERAALVLNALGI